MVVEYNTVIIGSGIAGMTAGIYLRRAGIKILIIENDMPGGELNKASSIENYPGYDSINGSDLAMNIYNQLLSYDPEYLFEEIKEIDMDKRYIRTSNKEIKYTNLVIATGRRSRTLGLKNEEKYIGRGISFCASCDGALYKNKDVVVVGGASTAISNAIYLSGICRKIYLVYRKDELRGEEILKTRLDNKQNIEIIYNANVLEYNISDGNLIGVKLDSGDIIDASCVFLAIGYIPNGELFDVKKRDGYIIVDDNYQTSREGVYACGDVIMKNLYQLVTSSSEGAMVANSIINSND